MLNQHTGFSNYFLIFHKDKLILQTNYTPFVDVNPDLLSNGLRNHHQIGEWDGKSVCCAEWLSDDPIPQQHTILPLKRAIERLTVEWYPFVARALAIIQWDNNNLFCGRCSHATIRVNHHFEKKCPACALLFYPRISPSVIVLIEKGDYLLMARSPHFAPGVFGLIAGFVEAGENLEETIHREVEEEVGLKIKALRYTGSQSWPFPDSLVIGFRAEYDSGELRVDHSELEVAGWYRYDDLPGYPSTSVSIARKLIDQFVLEKQGHC